MGSLVLVGVGVTGGAVSGALPPGLGMEASVAGIADKKRGRKWGGECLTISVDEVGGCPATPACHQLRCQKCQLEGSFLNLKTQLSPRNPLGFFVLFKY